jgi:hypothetical protein
MLSSATHLSRISRSSEVSSAGPAAAFPGRERYRRPHATVLFTHPSPFDDWRCGVHTGAATAPDRTSRSGSVGARAARRGVHAIARRERRVPRLRREAGPRPGRPGQSDHCRGGAARGAVRDDVHGDRRGGNRVRVAASPVGAIDQHRRRRQSDRQIDRQGNHDHVGRVIDRGGARWDRVPRRA